MATRMTDLIRSATGSLRFEPVGERVRARLGGQTVLDSTRAVRVWEPRRIVAALAVPAKDVRAELTPSGDDAPAVPSADEAPVLLPFVPFAQHTAPGTAADLSAGGQQRPGAAFRLEDPDLAGMVLIDPSAPDEWLIEDEAMLGVRDPFHRVDSTPSSRGVRVELDGVVVARSSRPVLVAETMLPPRFYLPKDDVTAELTRTGTSSVCPYKGVASYWSLTVDGRTVEDAAWSYEEPLPEAAAAGGHVCFDDTRVTVLVDDDAS